MSQIRLIIADDHPLYRSSVERVVRLSPELSVVGLASDGREALEMVHELRPDIAVVDLNMPELDGIELLDALVQEGSETKVVILTGHLESEQVYRAVELGAAAVQLVLRETVRQHAVDGYAGKSRE